MRVPYHDLKNPTVQHRTDYYGAFAFGSVIVTCFMSFVVTSRVPGQPWQVVLTFVLGALYGALGVLDDAITLHYGKQWRPRVFVAMLVLVTVMIFVSPVRGFFSIIVLPLLSQAIFDYSPRRALTIGLYLYGLCVGVLWYYYGIHAVPEALVSYVAAFAFTIAFTAITKQALNARDREGKLRAELETANEKLRAYAAQAEELATTRERNRLAREIHDGVGHYLTVVKTQLDVASAVCTSDPATAKANIEKAAKLASEALDDVRRSVGTLRTDASRPPLPEALRQLAAHGEPVPTLALEGTPRPLSSAIEHALYRATQEGLTNIRKHARASTSTLRLDFRDSSRVLLEIADDGVGQNSAFPGSSGFGLTGLRERIELLGGNVHAGNRLAGGFVLRIEVPA